MWRKILTTVLSIAIVACATGPKESFPPTTERLDNTKNWEVGDAATWNFIFKGRTMRLSERVVEVTDTAIRSILKADDRSYEAAVSIRDLSVLRGMSMASGQWNEFSVPYVLFDFPLEKGKTWSGKTTTTEEEFICDIAYDSNVDGKEMIAVPAGKFEAYKVSGSETLRCTNREGGGPWFGMANFRYWVTKIKGKVVFVKNDYQNSFAVTWSRELVAAELK